MRQSIRVSVIAVTLLASLGWGQTSGTLPPGQWQVSSGASSAVPTALPADLTPPRSYLLQIVSGGDLTLRYAPACPLPTSRFRFLYRTPTMEGERALSASLVFGSADATTQLSLPSSTRWRVAELAQTEAWPTGDWQLRVTPAHDTDTELLLPGDPSVEWSPEQALRDLAAAYAIQGKANDRRVALESLAELLPRTGEAALALRDCADILAASGDPQDAVNAYVQALDEQGSQPESWATFPGGPGYGQNRLAADFADQARVKLAEVAAKCPPDVAAEAYRVAAMQYPLTPTAKAAALAYARAMSVGEPPSDAAAWLVLVLDQGGDHDPVKATLRLAENQVHLDAISKPTDRALLTGAMQLLLSASGETLPAEVLAQVTDAWIAGEEAGLRRDQDAVTKAFSQAADAAGKTVLAASTRVALSQWLQYLGYFIEAEGALPERAVVGNEAVVQWRDFQLGRVLVSQGIFDEAEEAFAQALAGPSVVLADYAALFRGECLECQGLWPEVTRLYTEIAGAATVPDVRRKAAFWAYRVTTLAKDYTPAIGTTAQYWGEDRQTQGQWDSYGDELFILGGRMAPTDLMGGRGAPATYRIYTTDSGRPAWWWNQNSVTKHPSVAADPAWGRVMACNWDDGGEQFATGTGPDLFVELSVPAGAHRVSLYLVNDFNYYEPNREYTIHMLGDGSKVLAACTVRAHEGGVYHHFAVEGPADITFRIYRNLSMNVLLQGVFIDKLGPSGSAMTDTGDLGPLEALLRPSGAGTAPVAGATNAAQRRAVLRGLMDLPQGQPSASWNAYRVCNAYGAGRAEEDNALRRVARHVEESLGREAAAKLWGEAADAQLVAGHRSGAARFTRYALEAAHLEDASPGDRVPVLRAAIERLQTGYQYHVSGSGGHAAQWGKWPVDEAYSEHLAGELIEAACKERTTMAAGLDLLPLARQLSGNAWRALPARLFEEIGVDSLGSRDLVLYSTCTEDHQARMKALKLAWAAGGSDSMLGRDGLRISLMAECTAAGDYDGAEALMKEMLVDPAPSVTTKANAAYNLAWSLHLQKQDDRSKQWFTLVASEFPKTSFGKLATKCLATEFAPPQAAIGE